MTPYTIVPHDPNASDAIGRVIDAPTPYYAALAHFARWYRPDDTDPLVMLCDEDQGFEYVVYPTSDPDTTTVVTLRPSDLDIHETTDLTILTDTVAQKPTPLAPDDEENCASCGAPMSFVGNHPDATTLGVPTPARVYRCPRCRESTAFVSMSFDEFMKIGESTGETRTLIDYAEDDDLDDPGSRAHLAHRAEQS